MYVSGRNINTSIPGQIGYKSVEKDANIREQKEFSWLLKG